MKIPMAYGKISGISPPFPVTLKLYTVPNLDDLDACGTGFATFRFFLVIRLSLGTCFVSPGEGFLVFNSSTRKRTNFMMWLVVWTIFDFPISFEFHHPNWLPLIFFRVVVTTNQGNVSSWLDPYPICSMYGITMNYQHLPLQITQSCSQTNNTWSTWWIFDDIWLNHQPD